ncbi:hypothetical protein JCM31447_09650 [Fluviispira sanaruensis]|uniref:Uncharacterized protein n=1 Tax=Fluviispira sanaruensis TaxID=2493639 RepID=A0A4P2VKT8_FLUSA|nr:hypothetical protein JCM31447_09650 [Fluviispira sanaruensis]
MSVSKLYPAINKIYAIPEAFPPVPAINSAEIPPIKANAPDIFKPFKNAGSADGINNFFSIKVLEAP